MMMKYTSFDRVFQQELIGTDPVGGTSRSANREVKNGVKLWFWYVLMMFGLKDVC